jgi:trigger factor
MVNVQTEHLDNHTARLTVQIEPDRLNDAMRRAARKLAQKARIPGFRPGKAPFNVVVSMLGYDYVLGEALDKIGSEIYKEALDTSGIEPYGPGNLDEIQEGGQKLIFTFPKQPEVALGSYRDIRLEHEPVEVTDEMVNRAMEDLRQRQAVVEPADRPARLGDQVVLSHVEVALLSDNDEDDDDTEDTEAEASSDATAEATADAGDEAEDLDDDGWYDDDEEDEDEDEDDEDSEQGEILFHEHNYDYILFEDADEERLYPGFAAEIVGAVAGDALEFTLEIPEDYDDSDIAGRTLFCEAHVQQVQSRLLPEWSDDLAKRISEGKFETILELRMDARQSLNETAAALARRDLANQALDKVVEGAALKYPDEFVDEYVDDFVESLKRTLSQQGLTLQSWLTMTHQTEDELRAQYREAAVQRAERALVVGEFVKHERLSVSDDDVDAEIDQLSEKYGGDQAGQFRQFFASDENRMSIHNDLITSRAMDRLAAIARGENPPIEAESPAADSVAATEAATETPPAATLIEAESPTTDSGAATEAALETPPAATPVPETAEQSGEASE